MVDVIILLEQKHYYKQFYTFTSSANITAGKEAWEWFVCSWDVVESLYCVSSETVQEIPVDFLRIPRLVF